MNKEIELKEIVSKYIEGKCSQKELEAAFRLFDDPYHNLALRPAVYEHWDNDEKEDQIKLKKKDSLLILNNIHNKIHLSQEKQSRKIFIPKRIGNLSKAAAILFFGILLGLLIQHNRNSEPFYYTAIAPKGSISQMVLPDNTVVYLNSGSQLTYSMNKSSRHREVVLEGEAWFDVKNNKIRPFVVLTPFYKVKVHGTQFNVKAYPADQEIATTLEDGSIEILSEANLILNQMKPGQQFTFNQNTKTFKTAYVKTRLFTSWKENKLIFINMNLKDLILLLERKYGVEIKVSDDSILDYHYDGTIKNESIIEVLELLKETLPIDYKIDGQNIIIQNNIKIRKRMK